MDYQSPGLSFIMKRPLYTMHYFTKGPDTEEQETCCPLRANIDQKSEFSHENKHFAKTLAAPMLLSSKPINPYKGQDVLVFPKHDLDEFSKTTD